MLLKLKQKLSKRMLLKLSFKKIRMSPRKSKMELRMRPKPQLMHPLMPLQKKPNQLLKSLKKSSKWRKKTHPNILTTLQVEQLLTMNSRM